MCDSDALARFDAVARRELKPYFDAIGDVIYSANSTLTRNDVIFWGINPGGDPAIRDPIGLMPQVQMTIEAALDAFRTRDESMLEVAWPNNGNGRFEELVDNWPFTRRYRTSDPPDFYPPGQAFYQRRAGHLLGAVVPAAEEAIVSNFVFLQTLDANQIGGSLANVVRNFCNLPCGDSSDSIKENLQRILKSCWRVHMEIFAIAKPKVLIVASKRAWDLISEYGLLENCTVPIDKCKAGQGEWDCCVYKAHFRNCDREVLGAGSRRGITIIQVPHLSRWPIDVPREDRQRAVQWVACKVQEAIDKWDF